MKFRKNSEASGTGYETRSPFHDDLDQPDLESSSIYDSGQQVTIFSNESDNDVQDRTRSSSGDSDQQATISKKFSKLFEKYDIDFEAFHQGVQQKVKDKKYDASELNTAEEKEKELRKNLINGFNEILKSTSSPSKEDEKAIDAFYSILKEKLLPTGQGNSSALNKVISELGIDYIENLKSFVTEKASRRAPKIPSRKKANLSNQDPSLFLKNYENSLESFNQLTKSFSTNIAAPTFYEILGVEPNASEEKISKRCTELKESFKASTGIFSFFEFASHKRLIESIQSSLDSMPKLLQGGGRNLYNLTLKLKNCTSEERNHIIDEIRAISPVQLDEKVLNTNLSKFKTDIAKIIFPNERPTQQELYGRVGLAAATDPDEVIRKLRSFELILHPDKKVANFQNPTLKTKAIDHTDLLVQARNQYLENYRAEKNLAQDLRLKDVYQICLRDRFYDQEKQLNEHFEKVLHELFVKKVRYHAEEVENRTANPFQGFQSVLITALSRKQENKKIAGIKGELEKKYLHANDSKRFLKISVKATVQETKSKEETRRTFSLDTNGENYTIHFYEDSCEVFFNDAKTNNLVLLVITTPGDLLNLTDGGLFDQLEFKSVEGYKAPATTEATDASTLENRAAATAKMTEHSRGKEKERKELFDTSYTKKKSRKEEPSQESVAPSSKLEVKISLSFEAAFTGLTALPNIQYSEKTQESNKAAAKKHFIIQFSNALALCVNKDNKIKDGYETLVLKQYTELKKEIDATTARYKTVGEYFDLNSSLSGPDEELKNKVRNAFFVMQGLEAFKQSTEQYQKESAAELFEKPTNIFPATANKLPSDGQESTELDDEITDLVGENPTPAQMSETSARAQNEIFEVEGDEFESETETLEKTATGAAPGNGSAITSGKISGMAHSVDQQTGTSDQVKRGAQLRDRKNAEKINEGPLSGLFSMQKGSDSDTEEVQQKTPLQTHQNRDFDVEGGSSESEYPTKKTETGAAAGNGSARARGIGSSSAHTTPIGKSQRPVSASNQLSYVLVPDKTFKDSDKLNESAKNHAKQLKCENYSVADLKFLCPKSSRQETQLRGDKFDISTTDSDIINNPDSVVEITKKALQASIDSSGIDPIIAAQVILIAAKNKGVSTKKQSLKRDLGAIMQEFDPKVYFNGGFDIDNLVNQAIDFSIEFQHEMRHQRLYTGNIQATDLVGARLKRLDPAFALELIKSEYKLVDPTTFFNNICDALGGMKAITSNTIPDSSVEKPITTTIAHHITLR